MPVILLVDHDHLRVARLAQVLEKSSAQIELSSCATSGLEKALEITPSLIMCYEQLPDFDAIELLQIKRDEPAISGIPLVVFGSSPRMRSACYRLGCDDFILLPDEEVDLVFRVRAALRRTSVSGVSGDFSHLNIIDVIQMLVAARRDGRLDVDCGDVFGSLCFKEGQVFNAICGAELGQEAFVKLLRKAQNGGSFNFSTEEFSEDVEVNIDKRTDHLLLGLASMLDET